MSETNSPTPPAQTVPPVSVFCRVTDELRINPLISAPKKPGILGTVDRFELIDVLGEGGMGVVFLARDATANAPPVAVKVLKAELAQGERAVEYFLKEALHMQRLSHPNILPVLEYSQKPAGTYFVMPYMERGSLDRWLQPGRPLAEDLTLRVARELASALNYAHGRGIIHRDIKPRNVLLDAQSRVCLTDFGLSRSLLNDSLIDVRRNTIEGTPHYLSPSAARGELEDTRGDIYAFGAVLYEMLTGQPPYSGASHEEIFARIRTEAPAPIRKLNPAASPRLVKIAERAMARSLEDRYPHISSVVSDLGESEKTPTGFPSTPWQSARHHPSMKTLLARPVWIGIGAVALIACGLGMVLWKRQGDSAPPSSRLAPGLTVVRKLTRPNVFEWSAELHDWNQDGVPEFFLPRPQDKKFLIISARNEILKEWGIPDSFAEDLRLHLGRGDHTGGSFRGVELLVSWRNGTNLTVSALNQQLHELKRFACLGSVVDAGVGTAADSGITEAQTADLDGDGKIELLMIVGSGFARKPRGLYCYDFESASLLWQHQTGPPLNDLIVSDLDHDGDQEIVVGSDAVGNGNRADDGTDDGQSYIFGFSSKGQLLWKVSLGQWLSRSTPILLSQGRERPVELYAWVQEAHEYFAEDPAYVEGGRVLRLSGQGAISAEYDARTRLLSCQIADLNRDGQNEVLVTDRLGNLHCLSADLSLQRQVHVVPNKYDFVKMKIEAIEDVSGDARPEIILASRQEELVHGMNLGSSKRELNVRFYHDVAVLILDSSLKVLARHAVADRWESNHGLRVKVASLNGGKRPELIVLGEQAEILRFD